MEDNRRIIKTDTIYNFLKTKFIGVYEELKANGLIDSTGILNFEIFQDQADFDGKIMVPTYAEDDSAQMINYGLFRYVGGDMDPSDFKLTNVYMMRYSFELLAFEDYRSDIKELMNHYVAAIDGKYFSLYEDDGDELFSTFIETQAFPRLTETIDANGADKFIGTIVIDMLFYENIAHDSSTRVLINGHGFPYRTITMERRMVNPEVDNAKTYESKFIPSRTSLAITMSGYYDTNLNAEVADWLLDEDKMSIPIRWYWTDSKKLKTGVYMVNSAKIDQELEALLTYVITLVPLKTAVKTHYGILVKSDYGPGDGSGEYAVGSTVTLNNELDNFDHWEIVELSNPTNLMSDGLTTVSDYFDSLDLTVSELVFEMPSSNLIIQAKPIIAE